MLDDLDTASGTTVTMFERSQKLEWFATLRGRLGAIVTPGTAQPPSRVPVSPLTMVSNFRNNHEVANLVGL